jgi:hypothetical protein
VQFFSNPSHECYGRIPQTITEALRLCTLYCLHDGRSDITRKR